MQVDPKTGEVFEAVKRLDEFGQEIPDPRPVRIPAGFRRPETLAEQVQRLVRTHISRDAEQNGMETWEEANDFDVDDDFDPSTPYETFFDPVLGRELTPHEFRQNEQALRSEYLQAQERYFEAQDRVEMVHRTVGPPAEGSPPREASNAAVEPSEGE